MYGLSWIAWDLAFSGATGLSFCQGNRTWLLPGATRTWLVPGATRTWLLLEVVTRLVQLLEVAQWSYDQTPVASLSPSKMKKLPILGPSEKPPTPNNASTLVHEKSTTKQGATRWTRTNADNRQKL